MAQVAELAFFNLGGSGDVGLIICTILDTLFGTFVPLAFDRMVSYLVVSMHMLRRRLAEDLSSNEAETLGWRLGRLFIRWRLFVDRRRHRLAGVNPSETIGWRLARLFFSWRLFVDMCQVRRAAVARVVLQRRPLDAATIDHVLSYLSADIPVGP